MNKLREKFQTYIELYKEEYLSEQCEQITDDFTLKFFKWCNVAKYEFPNEMSLEEKVQYFKKNIYGKE